MNSINIKKLFGNNIQPACEYCVNGTPSFDHQMILCGNKGVVAPYYSCRQFDYCPFKRIPKRVALLPKYNKNDFEL